MTPNNIPEKKPEDRICSNWKMCVDIKNRSKCHHAKSHTYYDECDIPCGIYPGNRCIQIPEIFQDKGGE